MKKYFLVLILFQNYFCNDLIVFISEERLHLYDFQYHNSIVLNEYIVLDYSIIQDSIYAITDHEILVFCLNDFKGAKKIDIGIREFESLFKIVKSPAKDKILIEYINESFSRYYKVISLIDTKILDLNTLIGYRFLAWLGNKTVIVEREHMFFEYDIGIDSLVNFDQLNRTIHMDLEDVKVINPKEFLLVERTGRMTYKTEDDSIKIHFLENGELLKNILPISNRQDYLLINENEIIYLDHQQYSGGAVFYNLVRSDLKGNVTQIINLSEKLNINSFIHFMNISKNQECGYFIITSLSIDGKTRVFKIDAENFEPTELSIDSLPISIRDITYLHRK